MAMNDFERNWARRYRNELWGAIGIYSAILFAVKRFMPDIDSAVVRVGVSLLPMIGVALAMWAIGRGIRTLDELQQRMILEIIVWSAGGVAFLTLSYGFLEESLGLPRLSMFVVWPLMGALWFLFTVIYAIQGKVKFLWPWPRK